MEQEIITGMISIGRENKKNRRLLAAGN